MARLQADVPKDRADCARRPYGRPQTFDALSRTHAHPLRSEASRHPRHRRVDEQADQLFAMTDPMAERIHKVGGQTLRSIGHIARTQRVSDNDADYVTPNDMLAELRDDNGTLAANLRATHDLCDAHRGIASDRLLEVWINETERRTRFLFESTRAST